MPSPSQPAPSGPLNTATKMRDTTLRDALRATIDDVQKALQPGPINCETRNLGGRVADLINNAMPVSPRTVFLRDILELYACGVDAKTHPSVREIAEAAEEGCNAPIDLMRRRGLKNSQMPDLQRVMEGLPTIRTPKGTLSEKLGHEIFVQRREESFRRYAHS